MDKQEWNQIKNFSMEENWGDPSKMNPKLIQTLDILRDKIGKPISIHCGYELRNTGGQHTLGNAVDCHCEGLSLVDFFLETSRFPDFKGIGVYPFSLAPYIIWRLFARNQVMKKDLKGAKKWGKPPRHEAIAKS